MNPLSLSLLMDRARATWWTNPRVELLAGLVVAIALIPEAISFSIIAGVDPKVGLYSSFTIAIVIAVVGGRSGMISAATGAMALVVVPLVRDHGVQYLFVAGIGAGVIQVVLRRLGVARMMRFVPRPVMVGFVNALAILIFAAQVPHFVHGPLAVWVIVVAGVAGIYLLPRLTRAVPSPLIVVVAVGAAVALFHLKVPLVSDMGKLPSALPGFGLPDVPFSFETLRIIAPYAFTLAIVGLIESLLTAQLIDNITDTPSDKHRECSGQGAANVVAGFLGGMPGCAMIGQSMINMRVGGRTRLSTFASGVFLIALLMLMGNLVGAIPVAALVSVMIVVAVSTFDWSSVRLASLRRTPRGELIVMVVTVAVVVETSNLAFGVGAGVLLSAIFFARRIAHLIEVREMIDPAGAHLYRVSGQLFFVSTHKFTHSFDFASQTDVTIDFSHAHIWDSSGVAALDAVVAKFEARQIEVRISGLNPHSEALHARLSGHLALGH
jgi:SulP family sulfate permease